MKWAFAARDAFTWAKGVPEEIYFNDVLPYAVADETRELWRGDFYQRFSKIVESAKTQREAVELINRSILNELGVIYSTQRAKPNQSPSESIAQGLASCTGLSILLIDAFRSVGIPARMVGVPSWTQKTGNHNWVEVWLLEDKSWHYTEYYPDAKGLNHAWFERDAAMADGSKPLQRIYASSWKKTGLYFPLVWNLESHSVNALDVTAFYKKSIDSGRELRVVAKRNGIREVLNVSAYQNGKLIKEGRTKGVEADMNDMLSIVFQMNEEVELRWSYNGSSYSRRVPLTGVVTLYEIELEWLLNRVSARVSPWLQPLDRSDL